MKTLFSLVAAAAVMLGMVSAPALAGDHHGHDGHRNGQRDWDHQGNNSGWRNSAHDNGNHGRYRGSYGNSRGDYYRGDDRADYRGGYRDYYRPNDYRPAPRVVYRLRRAWCIARCLPLTGVAAGITTAGAMRQPMWSTTGAITAYTPHRPAITGGVAMPVIFCWWRSPPESSPISS